MALQYDPVSGTYYDDGLDSLGGSDGVNTSPSWNDQDYYSPGIGYDTADTMAGIEDQGFWDWLKTTGNSVANSPMTSNIVNALTSPSALAAMGGGVLGGIGAKQTGTQTSTQAPWEAQQPYLRDLFAKAQGAMTGSLAMSGEEQAGLEAMKQRAMSGSDLQDYGSATMKNVLSGTDYNPLLGVDNPYLTQTIDAASQDAMRNMQSMFNQQNRASGSFGNTGLAEAQTRTAANTLGNIATGARFQDYTNQQGLYESDINRRIGVAGQAPTMAQADYADAQRLYDIGQTKRFDPYSTLGKYGSLIQGQYGNTQTSPLYENKGAQILGGAAVGSGLLSAYNKNQQQPNTIWGS